MADQQIHQLLERRGRLDDLYEHDDDPLFPNPPNDSGPDFTDDEGSVSITDFQDYDQGVHAFFVDEMNKAVAQLRGIGIPRYKSQTKNLWHLVYVVRYISFCRQTWEKNVRETAKHTPQLLNRWEMEACWYRLLMKAYESWDPRTMSKRKVKKRALEFKKKVLQTGMKQIYGAAANEFWAKKKAEYPQITITNHCEWPNENSFDEYDDVYGPIMCSPPVDLPEIQGFEIENGGDDIEMDDMGIENDEGEEFDDVLEMNRGRLENMDLDD